MNTRQLALIAVWAVLFFIMFMIGYGLGKADAQERAGCNFNPTTSAAQARVKATCVAAKRSLDRGEGYTVRVASDACEFYRGRTWRCRASGHSGISPCALVIRVRGISRDPAKLATRVTFRSCAP